MFDPSIFVMVLLQSLKALPVTLALTILPVTLGTMLGLVLAMLRHDGPAILGTLATAWVAIVRGTPVIVLIFLVYFLYLDGLDALIALLSLPFSTADIPLVFVVIAALTAMVSAFACDAWRSALLSVPKGQTDAALSLGLRPMTSLRLVIMPQMLPVALPQLGNILIGTLKATSLAYLVSVTDIMSAAMSAASTALRFTEAYAAVALIYWLLTALAARGVTGLERRFAIPTRTSRHG